MSLYNDLSTVLTPYANKIKRNESDISAIKDDLGDLEDCFETEEHSSLNLLDVSRIETGCYYWTNGKNTNASYNSTPLIPVTPGQTLWFQYGLENAASRKKGSIRFAIGYNANGVYVSGSEKGTIYSYVVPDGVSYVRFSTNFNTLTGPQKPVIIAQDEDVVLDYIPYFEPYTTKKLKSEYDSQQTDQNTADIESIRQQMVAANSEKAIFTATADTLNANANLICCQSCDNKKNEYIELTAEFDTFGELTIAHGKDAYMGGYITITATKIIVYSYNGTQYEEFTHGLTLSDFINVIIYTKNIHTCRSSITVMTAGGDYTVETTRYYSCRAAVLCNANFDMTNVKMQYIVNDAKEDVWVFGDSYLSLGDPNRWAHQIVMAEHKNILLCGYGGAKSVNEIVSFRNLTAVVKPKFVVWTLGMNDGDSSSAFNADWKTYVDEVIATCEEKGITPILATIPNVPNIIHTFKNAYVRSSGCRYVDFAKAVNAESAGASWYTGMLATDNTHPTVLGAKALMRQFLLDVPEVLYAEE